MTLVGIIAGLEIDEMTERVIDRIAANERVRHIWVATNGKTPRWLRDLDRLTVIEMAFPKYNDLWKARNRLLDEFEIHKKPDDRWFHIGDNDGLPAFNYYDVLEEIPYSAEPMLVTGKLYNYDGKTRYYDICGFEYGDGPQPVCLPYDNWKDSRYNDTRYANGNQHILNRSGLELGIRYPEVSGEDPHFSWAFVKAGGTIEFNPLLTMQLAKPHGGAAMAK